MEERAPHRSSSSRHLRAVPAELSGLDKFAFLARSSSPAEFLEWVSGLVAHVHDRAEQGSVPMRDLLRSLGANACEGALAVLAAIEAMSPELDDRFEAATQLARLALVEDEADVVHRIRDMLDDAQAVNAGEICHDHGDTSIQLLELDIGGAPLTLLLTIDHNANHCATDLRVLPQTLRSFQLEIADQPHGGTFRQEYPHMIAARFRHVVEQLDQAGRQAPLPKWQRELQTLFWWATSMSDCGESSGYGFLYWSPELQRRLVDHFRASDIGQAACTPTNELHLETLSHIATMRGHGHPELWGPGRIELCLMDWFPYHYDGRAPAHEFLGLLRGWIEWCSTLTVNAGRDFVQVFQTLDDTAERFLDLAELFDEAVERDDLVGLKQRRSSSGFEDNHDDAGRPWQKQPDTQAAVGRDFVTQIDEGPLVDDEFDWTGLSRYQWVTTFDTVRSVEECCAAMLTPEYAASAKRLIRKIVWNNPAALYYRGTVEQNAMAIVWIICSANAMFTRAADRPSNEPRVRVKDLATYFSLSPNAHRKRVDYLLGQLGLERLSKTPLGLADPELLVANRRAHLRSRVL